MTRGQYFDIRSNPDFLYQYFIIENGSPIGDLYFNIMLQSWLSAIGVPFDIGVKEIVNFLDKKFV